jgi:integrase
MHPEADLSYLRDAVGALKANAKPRAKLPRMADHRALIELGEALIAHGAANPDQDHMLSAVAIRDGCMILFAVACPLRRSNFEALELGASLLRDELGYRVAFEASAMKNHRPFETDLPDWLTPHLDLYCETARQTLRRRADAPDGGSLWLGAEGEPVTGKAISRKLRQLITRHLGRAMSLHLFRDGATTTVAVEASVEIGIAGDLLGHADPKTSEKYYNQARGVEASRRYHVALDDLRRSE